MPVAERKSAAETLTLRLARELKEEFVSVAQSENRPASEVLRDLMAEYVKREKRRKFEAEARRQSALLASSFVESDEKELMLWFEGTWSMEDWTWEG
jgi:predicted transcriptional regulator